MYKFFVPGKSGFIKFLLDKVLNGLYIMIGRFLKILDLFSIRFCEFRVEST